MQGTCSIKLISFNLHIFSSYISYIFLRKKSNLSNLKSMLKYKIYFTVSLAKDLRIFYFFLRVSFSTVRPEDSPQRIKHKIKFTVSLVKEFFFRKK